MGVIKERCILNVDLMSEKEQLLHTEAITDEQGMFLGTLAIFIKSKEPKLNNGEITVDALDFSIIVGDINGNEINSFGFSDPSINPITIVDDTFDKNYKHIVNIFLEDKGAKDGKIIYNASDRRIFKKGDICDVKISRPAIMSTYVILGGNQICKFRLI